jgi:hypothetical protein
MINFHTEFRFLTSFFKTRCSGISGLPLYMVTAIRYEVETVPFEEDRHRYDLVQLYSSFHELKLPLSFLKTMEFVL